MRRRDAECRTIEVLDGLEQLHDDLGDELGRSTSSLSEEGGE